VLEVDAISKSFGSLKAVDALSFTAQPGSVFGLLGPNGAGKTTTIRMILDIIAPDSGVVRWAGKKVNADIRHSFGYLPEERGLYPKMRVRDQLLFLAQLHGATVAAASKRIDELATSLNLTENFAKTSVELSKGNQQKVQFIAAVAHDPPLLVLDEPFSGFDPINVEVVKQAIRDLMSRGTAVLLSSHRMEQVEELCQDVCIIDRSRAVLSGNLRQIKHSWPERFVRMTRVENTSFLDAYPGSKVTAGNDGLMNVTLSPSTNAADVLRAAMNAGSIDHFEVVEPSLNDIYLSAVKPEAARA
jgi:ABC-2 type transport system ATP-binding protein